MPFIITSPPTKRKKKIDGTFLLIEEQNSWAVGTEIWCFTQSGCLIHPDNGTYELEEGGEIKVTDKKISFIGE